MSVLIRDGALEYLHDEIGRLNSEIDDLTQEVINMTIRAEAAEAQLARVMADREVSV